MDIELSIIKEEQYDTNYGGRYLCACVGKESWKTRDFTKKRVYKPMNAHYIEYEQLKQKYRK